MKFGGEALHGFTVDSRMPNVVVVGERVPAFQNKAAMYHRLRRLQSSTPCTTDSSGRNVRHHLEQDTTSITQQSPRGVTVQRRRCNGSDMLLAPIKGKRDAIHEAKVHNVYLNKYT